jgi:parallel beta-helix repeat protein
VTVFLVLSGTGFSSTWYVPDHFPAGIQAALSDPSVVSGDTVVVRPGTYVENIAFLGKAVTLKSEKGPSITVIDGGQVDSVVSFMNAEGPGSVLDGFTITNGIATGGNPYGGGVRIWDNASPTVRNNKIIGNSGNSGGGITCWSGTSPQIENNFIAGNSASLHHGGGIACISSSNPTITGNQFTLNSAVQSAGGIWCHNAHSGVINGNYFDDNMSNANGGAIRLWQSSPLVQNNIIVANGTLGSGGGIDAFESPALITNNTVVDNFAAAGGGGISASGAVQPTVTNTIFWVNNPDEITGGPAVTYCDVTGGWPGAGNINANPFFVFEPYRDLHLTYPSSCRDAGSAGAPGLPAVDFDGNPRSAYGAVDIGADEFSTHFYYTGNPTPGGNIVGKLVGLPGTAQVGLFIGSGQLVPPMPTMWGLFHLLAPWWLFVLPPIPANGIMNLPATLPAAPPPPYDLYMQAIIGNELTDLLVIKVE